MAIGSLIRFVSRLCAEHGVSLYTLAGKYDWPEEAVANFLRGRTPPTARMLREMARDLETSAGVLTQCLDE